MRRIKQFESESKININKLYLFFSVDAEYYWWYRWCTKEDKPGEGTWVYYLSTEIRGGIGMNSNKDLKDYMDSYIRENQQVWEFDAIEEMQKYLVIWKLRK